MALLELSRLSKRLSKLRDFIGPMLVFAAFFSCVTVLLGLLLGMNEGHSGALVDRHRSRGIAVAIFSCLAAALHYTATQTEKRVIWTGYAASFIAAIGMIGLTAHDGVRLFTARHI